MKSYRTELRFNVPSRRGFVNITPELDNCVRESRVQEGLLLCNAMHITASVFINDNESGLHQDFEKWLRKLAPEKPYSQYAHNGSENNADAHLIRRQARTRGDYWRVTIAKSRRRPAMSRRAVAR